MTYLWQAISRWGPLATGSGKLPESVGKKLHRAGMQIDDLVVSINRYVAASSKSTAVGQPHLHTPTEKVFEIVPTNPPPLVEWGVQIGEITHNLRSALDHAMWHLDTNRSNSTAFPIYARSHGVNRHGRYEEGFHSKRPSRRLGGIAPPLRGYLERIQPYRRWDANRFNPLLFVHEMNRIDKHRSVPAIITPATHGLPTVTDGHGVHAEVRELPYTGDPQFPRFVATFPMPVDQMQVEGKVSIGIGVEVSLRGSKRVAMPVDDVLRECLQEVTRVTREIEAIIAPVPRWPRLIRRLP